jgi:ferredoxin-nitrate reductase
VSEPTPLATVHPLVAGYRCWCVGVDGARVTAAVAAGADSLEAVRRATGAATRCGSCRPELEGCVRELLAKRRPTR